MTQKRKTTLLRRFPKDHFAADVEISTHYIGNVIDHKFSHSDVSYGFNRKNVSVMLEFFYSFPIESNPRIHSENN